MNAAYVPGEVLVKFRSSPGPLGQKASRTGFLEEHDAELIKTFEFSRDTVQTLGGELAQLKLPEGLEPDEAVAQWSRDPRVEYVATNDILEVADGDPISDGSLNKASWGLHNIGQTRGTPGADISAVEAWKTQTGRVENGPLIAVVDTGIDYNHPALRDNIWTNPGEIAGDGVDNDGNGVIDDVHGYDARGENGAPLDDNGHGSHCAAIIGAAEGNSEKISGVMKHAHIASVRFLNKLGMGKLSDAIEGLAYADRIGARIVSNSWAGGDFNPAMYDVLKASPALHVFAAGNESNDNDRSPSYPATFDLPNIISVAATDHNDVLADFSNHGPIGVDIAAPGVDILSAYKDGGYKTLSGTSMATPFVAGAAGLLVSEYPDISNEEIKHRLLNSADPVPGLEGKVKAGGRLNAARALEHDEVAPAPATGLQARQTAPGRVQVEFASPGDDGLSGQASRFRILARAEGEVRGVTVASGRPLAVGQSQTVEIQVPRGEKDKTVTYSVVVEDNVGNASHAEVDLSQPGVPTAFEPGKASDKATWGSRWAFAQVEDSERGPVWTDSPEGNYKNESAWLRSKEISLAGLANPKLVFDARTDLQSDRDFLNVEVGVKEDGAVRWRQVARFTGTSEWSLREVDLSKYRGQDVRVSFFLQPDGSGTQDGLYLDNISVVSDER